MTALGWEGHKLCCIDKGIVSTNKRRAIVMHLHVNADSLGNFALPMEEVVASQHLLLVPGYGGCVVSEYSNEHALS